VPCTRLRSNWHAASISSSTARADWGHAAADYALTLGDACAVGQVLLFHHDPVRTDDEVDALRASLTVPAGLDVRIAVEGDIIQL